MEFFAHFFEDFKVLENPVEVLANRDFGAPNHMVCARKPVEDRAKVVTFREKAAHFSRGIPRENRKVARNFLRATRQVSSQG